LKLGSFSASLNLQRLSTADVALARVESVAEQGDGSSRQSTINSPAGIDAMRKLCGCDVCLLDCIGSLVSDLSIRGHGYFCISARVLAKQLSKVASNETIIAPLPL
jgi:hypothetical protein